MYEEAVIIKKKRIMYAAAFVLLVAVEVLIGMFVHDDFVRPYIGDVLVVIVLYCIVRVFVPEKFRFLPAAIFIFSAGVELLQGFDIADKLGIQSQLVRTIIGTVCDPKDILCYAAGCFLLGIWEVILFLKRK